MNELSLFSGYGGFTLGLRLAGINVRTICYVEIEPYCQEIIKARIRDGFLDDAPIWDDIRTFRGEQFRGLVDIITAGWVCKPLSRAGISTAPQLWPETTRIISEVCPRYVLLENVDDIAISRRTSPYALEVIADLAKMGYLGCYGIIPSGAIGAPHERARWFALGYADRSGLEGKVGGRDESKRWSETQFSGRSWWSTEPPICRVDDGCADRVGQLKALGNGIVPACVALFLKRISSKEEK